MHEEKSKNMINELRKVHGIHDDGTVISIVTAPMDGKVLIDVTETPYIGTKPTKQMMDEEARKATGCETAKTVSNIECHLEFDEENVHCPNVHHVGH